MQKFKIVGKPSWEESKWKERKRRKKERKKKNYAKFSGHYIRQRTHNVCAHGLRSQQLKDRKVECGRLEVTMRD